MTELDDALAALIREKLAQGTESTEAPDGWFISQSAAAEAAETSGLYQPSWGPTGQGGSRSFGTVYPFDIIRNGLYFTHVDKKVDQPADARYSLAVDPENGNTYAIDMANPTKPKTASDLVFKAAEKAPEGSVPIGDKIPLGNGKFMQPYAVTDGQGNTVRTNVISEEDQPAPTAGDVVDIDGGRLIPRGNGT